MRRVGLVILGLALAAGGFAAGRRSVAPPPRDREGAALRQRLALAEAQLQDQARERGESLQRHVKDSARARGFAAEADAESTEEAFPIDRKLARVEELVAAIEGMINKRELFRQDVMDFVEERLVTELRANPAALAWVLDRFRDGAGTDVGAILAISLGQVKDPSVEGVALDLARTGGSQPRQLAGLELLDRLDIENVETRHAVLDLLRTGGPSEITAAAIYALNHSVTDPRETREVVATLLPLVSDANAEVRRRAVIALAEWAPDAAALDPVVRALSDPSVDVRAGAAFALGQVRVVPPGLVDALAARVAGEHEDWAVREQAWTALSHFPLDERSHAVFAKFREEHDAVGEASGSTAGAPHDH